MSKLSTRIIALGVAIFMMSMLLVGCGGGNKSAGGDKAAQQKIVLKLGTETATSHPETKGSQKLADLVKEKSKGTLEIQVFDSAKIGSMKERTEGMRCVAAPIRNTFGEIVAGISVSGPVNRVTPERVPAIAAAVVEAAAAVSAALGARPIRPPSG